jgi:hypothetical protein
MKDDSEIRQKLKQAQYRHVKRILRGKFPRGVDWPKDEVEDIKDEYRAFFQEAQLHEIARDFPDVAALMWVLEEQPDQALVVNGTLVGSMGGVMLWADSDEDADAARGMIDQIVDLVAHEPQLTTDHPQKSWWRRLFG